MKKRLFKLLAVMMCMMLVLSACSKDEPAKEEPTSTEAPTAEITDAVTEAPTEKITEAPTEESTAETTLEPTEEPTAAPTEEPTEEPTAEPTEEPTAEPTEEPTLEPTEEPADVNGGEGAGYDIPEESREFTKEDIAELAELLKNLSPERSYTYMDIQMTMEAAGQTMDVYMTDEFYKFDNVQRSLSVNNMLGVDMAIDSYTVEDENGNLTSYVSYDNGNTWMKTEGGAATEPTVIGDNADKFVEQLKNCYITETTTGYTVTGQMQVEYQEGMMLPLNCEFYLTPEGAVSGYRFSLLENYEGEESGTKYIVTKFDVEFEADCAEFEIPEAALNAGDMNEADLSGLLGGLGLDEVVEEATEDVTEEVAE